MPFKIFPNAPKTLLKSSREASGTPRRLPGAISGGCWSQYGPKLSAKTLLGAFLFRYCSKPQNYYICNTGGPVQAFVGPVNCVQNRSQSAYIHFPDWFFGPRLSTGRSWGQKRFPGPSQRRPRPPKVFLEGPKKAPRRLQGASKASQSLPRRPKWRPRRPLGLP